MPLIEFEKRTGKSATGQAAACTIRLARPGDAESITAAYEHVFGKMGIKAPGHEAYPAPEVFTPAGVRQIIADEARRFIVAEVGDQIAGGMIINLLSPYNCEFCCVAVDPTYRNLGISPKLLSFARRLADQSSLSINSTEIVTHSVLSQTAHNGVGYGKVTGFGYCQYPRVFFREHEESVLWISEIQGRIAQALQAAKSSRGIEDHAPAALNDEEQKLFFSLRAKRHVFVPESYAALATEILSQFAGTIDYVIHSGSFANLQSDGVGDAMHRPSTHRVVVDLAGDEPYSYIKLPSRLLSGWQQSIDEAIASIKGSGKRFIQAKIPANSESAASYSDYLRANGFVFLGLLPLNQFHPGEQPYFEDMLLLQWLDERTIAANPLPGETDSVIKIFGYPANLSGRLFKVIRNELAEEVRR
jgi:GNAT superfamily N-acetyltransferase